MIKKVVLISLLPYIMYLGVGYYYIDIDFSLLFVMSILFTIGINVAFLVFKYCIVGIKLVGSIYSTHKGRGDMNRASKNTYNISFFINNKEYTKRISYKTSSNYNVGDKVAVYVDHNYNVFIAKDLYILIFFMIIAIFIPLLMFVFSL